MPTFSDAKGWDFQQDLWNGFAHIWKCLKTFWKCMKTTKMFPKMPWTYLDLSPRTSFTKHNLFSFENCRVFRRRTIICMRFLIHYCFECKLHVYMLHFFQYSLCLQQLIFFRKIRGIGPYVWVSVRSKFWTHGHVTYVQGMRVGRYNWTMDCVDQSWKTWPGSKGFSFGLESFSHPASLSNHPGVLW